MIANDVERVCTALKACPVLGNLPLAVLFKLQPAHDGSKKEPLCPFTEALLEEEKQSVHYKNLLQHEKQESSVGAKRLLAGKQNRADEDKPSKAYSKYIKISRSCIESQHLKQSLAAAQKQQSTVPLQEVLDEVCVYLQRSLQFLWILCEVRVLEQPVTDTCKAKLLQLQYRLRLSCLVVLQLAQESRVNEHLESMNQYQILEHLLALKSVLGSQEPLVLPTQAELLVMTGFESTEI